MDQAVAAAWSARHRVTPRPWVGAVVVTADGARAFTGATDGRTGPHAEVVALAHAGAAAAGATMYCTLEPCSHHGLTPPCAEAIADAGIARVVVAVTDPDPQVSGRGVAMLRHRGVDVEVGEHAGEVSVQLEPYLHHRRTGRPFVVLKLAATADGRTAAADRTSQWITSADARCDAHRLRADSDAIVVGAGTVRADDPTLTVRLPGWEDVGDEAGPDGRRQPLRLVLGSAPATAAIQPCEHVGGDLGVLLDDLGQRGVVQLLVEGGPTVAAAFHRAGLVDRYVLYLAPALAGGDDGLAMFTGPGAASIDGLWRGQVVDVRHVGDDVRIDLAPRHAGDVPG